MTRRRRFLLAAGALAAAPLARAQQPRKPYRIGIALTTSPVTEMAGANPDHPGIRAFLHELRNLGYVEGQNLILERRSAEGKFDRFAEIVADLARQKVDLVVVAGDELAVAASKAAPALPVVMASSRYPVEAGLARSLARPGGNITGLTINPGPQVEAKRFELLKAVLPKISRVAFLGRKTEWDHPIGNDLRAAARALGITLQLAEHVPDDYAGAFAGIESGRFDAFFVVNSPPNFGHRRAIVAFAAKNRLPGSYPTREYVDIGGLMSYGMNAADLFRRAAIYADKILRGAKPGDLPIEQPTKFELVINLKTAAALGVSIPQGVLLRADEVIR